MAAETVGLPQGTRLGPYEVVSPVGVGGMGEVYRAKDTRLGRLVAVKVLPAGVASDPDRRKRFEREARAVAALSHPNICTVFDVGREETASGPVDYLVMELLEGETLARHLHRGPMPTDQLLKAGIEIASALDRAHRAGVVHRDVKPGNVVLTKAGAKLLDFGLAQLRPTSIATDGEATAVTGDLVPDDPLTAEGRAVGTYPYMAPEQLEGKAVDARADLFALGAVLYEMATGRRAFPGTSHASIAAAILTSEPPSLTSLRPVAPLALERLVKLLLAKDPEERMQSAHDVTLRLREITEEGPSAGTSLISKGARPAWGWWVVVAALLALALSPASLRIWSWLNHASRESSPPLLLTRLTSEPGVQMDPVLSPDGKLVVYAADAGGNVDLWVKQVTAAKKFEWGSAGGAPVRITDDPLADWQPDWSPDGSRIVFRSERDGGGLYVAPALGGRAQRLASFGYNPRFSPDGSRVLFHSSLGGWGGAAYVLDVSGGNPRRVLTGLTQGWNLTGLPGWHPDGQRVSLLLVVQDPPADTPSVLWRTISLRDGAHRDTDLSRAALERMDAAALDGVVSVEWAPSGDSLFIEGVSRQATGLWRAAIDPATFGLRDIRRVTAGPSQESGFRLSRDGRSAVFIVSQERHHIWSLPFDAGTGRVSGEGEILFAEVEGSSCDLSRDGGWLACSGREGLWVGDVRAKRQLRPFADHVSRDTAVVSPDSQHIAFARVPAGDLPGGVYVATIDGRDERLVRADTPRIGWAFGWSPDGRWVVGTSPRGPSSPESRVWLAPAVPDAGTEAQVLASSTTESLWQSRLSPDGRWLAFNAVQDAGGGSIVWVTPRSGGEKRRLTSNHWDDVPRWSPDGRILYFLPNRAGFWNVWAAPFDPQSGRLRGEPFPVTRFERPSRFIPSTAFFYGLSRDRLVLGLADRSSSVWMAENIDR